MPDTRQLPVGAGQKHRFLALRAVVAALSCFTTAVDAAGPGELVDLSLEELAEVQITSVSRRAERLADAPAAVFVITSDDIRRSGATSLADALRVAPNLQVARVDARTYAISARGFNNAIGNKLLVLIDGRTVYSPQFSGVFWDQQDVMLEDVERIEVISGPGGTQWGANAVNGVINVITRRAADTQGVLATVTSGNTESGYGARYGGKIGDDGAWRVYAKAFDRTNTFLGSRVPVADAWERSQVGFRADWGTGAQGFTLQGDAYQGRVKTVTPLGTPSMQGANLLARWTRRFEDGSDVRVQGYVDSASRDDLVSFRDRMRVTDIEVQYGMPWGDKHKFLFGGGYRSARDSTDRSLLFAFVPPDRDLRWANVFVQDTVKLAEKVQLTAGAKLESNVYTGWEFLPSARIAWKPDGKQLVWGALSRAVRAPARLDRELFLPGTPLPGPVPFLIRGGPNFEAELATVAEIGYRAQPTPSVTYSVSVFRNSYSQLRSGQPPPAVVQNMIDGNATGLEAWGSWQATKAWRLNAGYTSLNQRLRVIPGSTDPTGPSALGNDADYQWMLRSSLNISPRTEFDVTFRRVGALPNPVVPAYTAVDARIGWRMTKSVQLSFTVQNGFDPGHPEFNAPATSSQVPRSAFLKMLWQP
jgi:iron complex outermembrane receptor protein